MVGEFIMRASTFVCGNNCFSDCLWFLFFIFAFGNDKTRGNGCKILSWHIYSSPLLVHNWELLTTKDVKQKNIIYIGRRFSNLKVIKYLEPILTSQKSTVAEFLVGLPLNRGGSNRVRSTSRGGRSPSVPSKNGTTGASGTLVNGTIGAPGRGRRSRSVSKVGIKLGAYKTVTVASTLCVDCLIILYWASMTFCFVSNWQCFRFLACYVASEPGFW